MAARVDASSSLIRRLWAWSEERYPLANAVLFVVLYAAALVFGRLQATSGSVSFDLRDVLGFAAPWCFFLMLRIFDEHKDYELDLKNYPDRVLQSGLITLGHLKALGVFAVLVQLAVSLWFDGGFGRVTIIWLIVMAWSALMAKEFFCGEWLAKRLVLYAFSHMLVMPMALVWMAQMGAGATPLDGSVGLFAGLSFLSGFSFEITRKIRAPEDERETVDSYTKIFGTRGAPLVVMALLAGGTAMLVLLLSVVLTGEVALYWYGVLAVGLILPVVYLQKFRSAPSGKAAKANEGVVGLAMLLGYLVVLIAPLVERGVRWG